MDETFYAQYGEDKWIVEHLSLPETGTYVDIGCGDPFEQSNTAFLRERGWHGVNVDGNPVYKPRWADIKDHFICSVISPFPVVTFNISTSEPWLSRIGDAGVKMYTIPMEGMLSWFGIEKINFLSIDVEGHELTILKSLDFGKHNPSIIVAEYNTRDIGEDLELRPFLESKGYAMQHKTVANMIFTL